MSFVYKIASDLKCSRSCSLTVTALKHVELLVLNGELHILHIMIVVLKGFANLDELAVSLGELLLHLCDRHRCTNTGYHVLALCVDEELTHQLLLAVCRVTGECYTCTGLVV